jgi:hypothetical protein
MDMNSMVFSKGLSDVMSLNVKFYFHPIDKAKLCSFGFSPFSPLTGNVDSHWIAEKLPMRLQTIEQT